MFTFTTDTFFSEYTLNYSYSHCQVGEEYVVRVTVLLKTLLNCRKCVEKKFEREASLKWKCDCQCSEDSLCPHLPSSLVYRSKIKVPQGKARWPRQRHRCRTQGCWETEWFDRTGSGIQKGLSLLDRMCSLQLALVQLWKTRYKNGGGGFALLGSLWARTRKKLRISELEIWASSQRQIWSSVSRCNATVRSSFLTATRTLSISFTNKVLKHTLIHRQYKTRNRIKCLPSHTQLHLYDMCATKQ